MSKQVKTEPMDYPAGKVVPSKTLKVWLALASTLEQKQVIRRMLKEQARRH